MNTFKNNHLKRFPLAILAVGCAMSVLFSSCLKNDNQIFTEQKSSTSDVVYLGNAVTPDSYSSIYQGFSLSGEFVNDTSGFYLIVQYSGTTDNAPEDINLKLEVDTAALSAYNADQGTEYVPFDDKMVSFDKDVTIKKGTDRTRIRVVVNDTTGFDFASTQALPIKISSSSYGTISSNLGTKIYAFTAKNKYDGVYLLSGYHNRSPYNYPYTNVKMQMISSGASSVKFYFVAASSYGHPIGVGVGSVSWYGASIAPEIIFDPETNLVTNVRNSYNGGTAIDIYTGAGSGQGRYDPDTKTIYVYWRYGANDQRAFIDTLVYTGVR